MQIARLQLRRVRRWLPSAMAGWGSEMRCEAVAPVRHGSAVEQDRLDVLFQCMFLAYMRYKSRAAHIFGAARANRGPPSQFRALPVRQPDRVCHGRNHGLRTMFTGH